jgi:excisionase family DNA binding protein
MSRTRRAEATDLPADRLFATAPETAQVFRSDERTIRAACERGEIPAVRIGQQWRIPMSWLKQAAGMDG